MAKFVIAGCANCPRFAKMELLCDQLSISLPDFHIFKIVKHPSEWSDWVDAVCRQNDWTHDKGKPMAWRELLDRGGKGYYIGAFNDLVEFAAGYYGVTFPLTSFDACAIAKENLETKIEVMDEEKEALAQITPLIVCITNASSPIAYHFTPHLMSGKVFGEETEIRLKLLDSEEKLEELEGLKMELEDGCYPLFRGVQVYTNPFQAFQEAKFIISFDDVGPTHPPPRRSVLLELQTNIFKLYAEALAEIYTDKGGEEEREGGGGGAKEEINRESSNAVTAVQFNSKTSVRVVASRDDVGGGGGGGAARGGDGSPNANKNQDDEEIEEGESENEEKEEEEEKEPKVTFILAGPGPVTLQAQTLLNWRRDVSGVGGSDRGGGKCGVGGGVGGEGDSVVVAASEEKGESNRFDLTSVCRVIAFAGFEETIVKCFLSRKMRVRAQDVTDVVLWGLINVNVHPDLTLARVHNHASCVYGPEWYSDPVMPKIYERIWLEEYTMFMREVMLGHRCGSNLAVQSAKMVQRQKANSKLRKIQEKEFQDVGSTRSKAMTHLPYVTYVDSLCLFFDNFLRGSDPKRLYSCGVVSDGSYGVPAGLVFSFPCSFTSPGRVSILGDLALSSDASEAVARMAQQMTQACQKLGLLPILPSEESMERLRLEQLDFYRRGWRLAEEEWSLVSLQDADFNRFSTAIGLREETQSKIWPKSTKGQTEAIPAEV